MVGVRFGIGVGYWIICLPLCYWKLGFFMLAILVIARVCGVPSTSRVKSDFRTINDAVEGKIYELTTHLSADLTRPAEIERHIPEMHNALA